MSGRIIGSFGYYRMQDVAYDLKREIEHRGFYYPQDVQTQLTQIVGLLEIAVTAARDADYLLSGDTGEDDWLTPEVAEVLDKLEGGNDA